LQQFLCELRARVSAGAARPAARGAVQQPQEQLAFEAEIDLTYMGAIERGKRNPSLLVMARIAEALSVPLGRLLTE
jgi:transcriptional regulator with XRE-family HTH domain